MVILPVLKLCYKAEDPGPNFRHKCSNRIRIVKHVTVAYVKQKKSVEVDASKVKRRAHAKNAYGPG
jgi:hypothetical protein